MSSSPKLPKAPKVPKPNTGGLQVYDIAGNQLVGSAFIGTVGTDYQFSGVGNFSSVPGASDLLLRSSTTGALQIYNIRNNQLTGSTFIGNVGTDYKFAGVAPISAAGRSIRPLSAPR